MKVSTYRNSRNECASTDGVRWWKVISSNMDENDIRFSVLQPATELFPQREGAAMTHETAAKARSAFISALRRTAPTVSPKDDAEKAVLRKAWDDGEEFGREFSVIAAGAAVFDCNLMVVGTADALIRDMHGVAHPYCYAPEGWEWGGEMNAVVRILHQGLPIEAGDDPHKRYTLRQFSRAIMALLTRFDTPWYVDKMKDLPF